MVVKGANEAIKGDVIRRRGDQADGRCGFYDYVTTI